MKRYIYSAKRDNPGTRYTEWAAKRNNAMHLYHRTYYDYEDGVKAWTNNVKEIINNQTGITQVDIKNTVLHRSNRIAEDSAQVRISIETSLCRIVLDKRDTEENIDITVLGYNKSFIYGTDAATPVSNDAESVAKILQLDWKSIFDSKPNYHKVWESITEPDPWESDEYNKNPIELEGIQYIVDTAIGKDMWFSTNSYGYVKFVDKDDKSYTFVSYPKVSEFKQIDRNKITGLINSFNFRDLGDTLTTAELNAKNDR